MRGRQDPVSSDQRAAAAPKVNLPGESIGFGRPAADDVGDDGWEFASYVVGFEVQGILVRSFEGRVFQLAAGDPEVGRIGWLIRLRHRRDGSERSRGQRRHSQPDHGPAIILPAALSNAIHVITSPDSARELQT